MLNPITFLLSRGSVAVEMEGSKCVEYALYQPNTHPNIAPITQIRKPKKIKTLALGHRANKEDFLRWHIVTHACNLSTQEAEVGRPQAPS